MSEAPLVGRPDVEALRRRRRQLDQQLMQLQRSADQLARQEREAAEAHRADRARELMTRLLAVRARLEEVELRRNHVLADEEQAVRG